MKKIIIIISIILNIFFIIYILCNDIDLKIQKKENKEIIEKLLPEEIPFYREEFQRIKIDDSFFNIEFINDNNNYYNEDQQQFFSVKQQYLSYMPEYTYIKRFQTIEISGQQKLHGGVLTVSDLRAGATLAIAALIADNESYVKGVSHISRGYENFIEKIQALGGEIREI